MKHQITIELSDRDYEALQKLAEYVPGFSVQSVIEYAARSLAEGIRRPGSWEASAVAALFGS